MLSRLRGRIESIGPSYLVVDVGAFGLQVFTPSSHAATYQVGQAAALYTHLHVREQEITLFGFPSQEELDIFLLLLGVSGVGPRLALNILSTLSPDALRLAVANEEPGVLTRVPGIGAKTARNIFFHLKDKLAPAHLDGVGLALLSDDDGAVIEALTSLGYSVVEAQRAVQALPKDLAGVEERLRLALTRLASA